MLRVPASPSESLCLLMVVRSWQSVPAMTMWGMPGASASACLITSSAVVNELVRVFEDSTYDRKKSTAKGSKSLSKAR